MTKFPKRYRLVITKRLPFRKKHESSVMERCEIFSSETHTVSEFVLCGSFFTSETVCILEVFVGRGHKNSETHTVLEVRIGTVLEIK